MPDLSSVLDFKVTFDLSAAMPKMVVEDVSSYIPGEEVDITGIFVITQPDSGVYTGVFTAPDVYYSGGSLTNKELTLSLASDGKVQQGTYTVSYTVSHPSYTTTVLSRTFVFSYGYPELDLTENFDVFAPALSYTDSTVYTQGSYTIDSHTRSWSVTMCEGVITGTGSALDFAYSGNYYDSLYAIEFTTDITYNHNTYTYLYVTDTLSESISTSANTPPTTSVLYDYLADLKDTLDDNINNDRLYNEYKRRYEYASSILQTIERVGCAGETSRIEPYLDDFTLVTHEYQNPVYTNTDAVILPYVFNCSGDGGGSGSTITKVSVTIVDADNIDYVNVLFSGKTLLMTIKEGLVLNDGDVVLSGTTASKTQSGDLFITGEKYIFILKS